MVKPIPQYGDDVGSTPALMSMLKCLNLCTESKHPIDLFLKNVQWYNGCTWGFDPHEPGSNPGWTTNLQNYDEKAYHIYGVWWIVINSIDKWKGNIFKD